MATRIGEMDYIGSLDLVDEIKAEVSYRIWKSLHSISNWLTRGGGESPSQAQSRLLQVISWLSNSGSAEYARLLHIARLVFIANKAQLQRAVRSIPSLDHQTKFKNYQRRRSIKRPLYWPSASQYVKECLPGPSKNAVVAVPTGAGKSFIAELAVLQALDEGWVLYLAPTNALVSQITRDIEKAIGDVEDVLINNFLGSPEYTDIEGGILSSVKPGTVLIMTPEKCSLALRLEPEAFKGLRLCIFDECHLMGEDGTRGVVSELVLSHVMSVAEKANYLLLSALIENPEELAQWIETATGTETISIKGVWRPTRTIRGVAGFMETNFNVERANAKRFLESHPNRRTKLISPKVGVMFSLTGSWGSDSQSDYRLLETNLLGQAEILKVKSRAGRSKITDSNSKYLYETTAKLASQFARANESVLVFAPKNRHHAFALADRIIFPFQNNAKEEMVSSIEAELTLAEYELGVKSHLRDLISIGISVHTSLLVDAEKHASELAFVARMTRVMVATGTLAQGLNLPASVVLVAGTEIGDTRNLTKEQADEAGRSQMLNAIGRAGRAGIANQGMAIVVPNRKVMINDASDANMVIESADFLRHQDASKNITSQLNSFISKAMGGDIDPLELSAESLVAYTYLPIQVKNYEGLCCQILEKSFGIWYHERKNSQKFAAKIASEVVVVSGNSLLEKLGAPGWALEVSYKANYPLQVVTETVKLLTLAQESDITISPGNTSGWIDFIIGIISKMPIEMQDQVLEINFEKGDVDQENEAEFVKYKHPWLIADNNGRQGIAGWNNFATCLKLFVIGATHRDIAENLLIIDQVNHGRSSGGNPIPRTLAWLSHFTDKVSKFAGLVFCIHEESKKASDQVASFVTFQVEDDLRCLPLHVKYGTNSKEILIWFKYGLRYRRSAHLLARLFPFDASDMTDEEAKSWVESQIKLILHSGFNRENALEVVDRLAGIAIRTHWAQRALSR